MSDVECPYCGSEQEICHDDGYGLDEDGQYEQECGDCGKVYAYTTMISVTHWTKKADCLNGSPHQYKPTATSLGNIQRCGVLIAEIGGRAQSRKWLK